LEAKPDSKNCWLRSGALRKKFFWGANLRRAKLFRADLEGADFNSANMSDADLDEARLIATGFAGANLEHTKFKRASLIGASMQEANLKDADFFCADLRGANLNDANLENARLIQAQFDATTKLPDGTLYDPHKGIVQLERFVSRSHPQFWRTPSNDLSPAYAGQLHRKWQRN
ncbi:MAG: pentapeptide repeat-containing protein, partial [Anaerolineae bacterium]|nr:pentapeptide repeat-containing protein [Anaerolineae bacterium]